MNDIVGINKEKLKTMILNINEYAEKINTIINDAQFLIEDTKNYYLSEDGEYIREKFNNFYSNKKIILHNIKSYAEDLNNVLVSFEKNQCKIVDIFKNK